MKYTVLILFLSLAFYSEAIFSQELSYNIKHYKINSGLSQNTVMSIYQDSKGFIWAGTKNGLNRFDGSNFKVYQRGDLPGDLKNSIIFLSKKIRLKDYGLPQIKVSHSMILLRKGFLRLI